jgi:hypothetical protein
MDTKAIQMMDNPGQSDSNNLSHEPASKRKRALSVKSNTIAHSVLDNLLCKYIGRIGFAALFTMLLVSAGQFIIFFIYANNSHDSTFQKVGRPMVWIFFLFSILYLLRIIHIAITWKDTLKELIEAKYDLNTLGTKGKSMRLSKIKIYKSRFKTVVTYYDENFGINGIYYLWILYVGELVESWVQFANVVEVYSCTLPVAWNLTFMIILMIHSLHQCKVLYRKLYTETSSIDLDERNVQVIFNIGVDLFFLFVPIATLWFGFRITISILEIVRIIIVPSISLFSTLPTIFEQVVYNRVNEEIAKRQLNVSKSFKRRRNSLFGQSVNEQVVDLQNRYFPRPAKMLMFVLKITYSIVILVLLIGQLVNLSFQDTCDAIFDHTSVWSGCAIKIPFCKRPFTPKCNCAYMHIQNDYTLTLPENIPTEMDGLRKLLIQNGNLTTLPKNMENLVQMRDFEVSFNRLEEFNVDVRKWKMLVRLFLMYNNIRSYNEVALWTHSNLASLDLCDNVGLKIPNTEIKMNMRSLIYLNVANNSVTIDTTFDNIKFPSLTYLVLNGNHLVHFPDQSLNNRLLQLCVRRCKLSSLPPYLSEFGKLRYLDARYNNITEVDDAVLALLRVNKVEAYFAGNDIACSKHKELDCEPLCSEYCWGREAMNNNFCDVECNSVKCNYDGGECAIY